MKNEVVKEFLIRLAQEKEFKEEFLKLQKKVAAGGFSNKDNEMFISECLVPWSKRLGYNLTRNDFITFDKTQDPTEITGISKEELANVVGGVGFLTALTSLLLVGTTAFGGTVGNFTGGSVLTSPNADNTTGADLIGLVPATVQGGSGAVSVVNDTLQNSPDFVGGGVVTGTPSASVPAQSTPPSISQSADSPYADLFDKPHTDGSSPALYTYTDFDFGPDPGQITDEDFDRDYGQSPANYSGSYVPDQLDMEPTGSISAASNASQVLPSTSSSSSSSGGWWSRFKAYWSSQTPPNSPSAASTNSSVGATSSLPIASSNSSASLDGGEPSIEDYDRANGDTSVADYEGTYDQTSVEDYARAYGVTPAAALPPFSYRAAKSLKSAKATAGDALSSGLNALKGGVRSVGSSIDSGWKTVKDGSSSALHSAGAYLDSLDPSTGATLAASAAGLTSGLVAGLALAATEAGKEVQQDTTSTDNVNTENSKVVISKGPQKAPAQKELLAVRRELESKIAELKSSLTLKTRTQTVKVHARAVLNDAEQLVQTCNNAKTLRKQLNLVKSRIQSLNDSAAAYSRSQSPQNSVKAKSKTNKAKHNQRRTAGRNVLYANRINN